MKLWFSILFILLLSSCAHCGKIGKQNICTHSNSTIRGLHA